MKRGHCWKRQCYPSGTKSSSSHWPLGC